MKKSLSLSLLLTSMASLPAMAHVDYTGQDLGTFTGLSAATGSVLDTSVGGNYGWADAADADWGNSHKGRFLKFTLENPADVTLSMQSTTMEPNSSGGVLLPGFSVYEGLAPLGAHDFTDLAFLWRDMQAGPAADEGYWNALGSFQAANEAGETAFLTFQGYAVDGTAANFGSPTTQPGVTGDGVADGMVSKSFSLDAGTYSVVVGGATYDAAGTAAGNRNYHFNADIAVAAIPEPETYAMLLAGLGLIGAIARRRKSA
ncbi:MAG: FxDxF family PEP-CTERM protein [Nitrosospira sp.]|nr:FxDxF family PEP-CTERM protein [Nitrosospira sp.]MDN5882080.1 FxDxF family PEP-CTERM protein [Nitrosospira sp.]MDN5934926.1 FxDxF family PEP-CTERM protein [Nitrosospira sp.]